MIYDFEAADNAWRLPLLPKHSKISFYKGIEVTRTDHIDDNFVSFSNDPFSSILDTKNGCPNHDYICMHFYKIPKQ